MVLPRRGSSGYFMKSFYAEKDPVGYTSWLREMGSWEVWEFGFKGWARDGT
jgi:hypothetical protein